MNGPDGESPRLVHTIAEVRDCIRAARLHGASIGFVPTMGALHQGHQRLIETACREAAYCVVSIFVNPTQFGPNEDFTRYPRTLEDDVAICAQAGASLVFAPSAEEIYPQPSAGTSIEVPGPSAGLCGAFRPGHFRGVATVVLKLFNIVQPDMAYFGEKDYQQLVVIQRMVDELNVPVEIRGVPTVREADGLALSSRNRYLSTQDRRAAVALWQALQAACQAVREGARRVETIRQVMRSTLESQTRVKPQYAEVVDAHTLAALSTLVPGCDARALVAAHVGGTRLIDNVALPPISDEG